MNAILEKSHLRWPFQRRSAAWLPTLTTNLPAVAQVGNLLYRRLIVGWAQKWRPVADCQSATQQTASLRYGARSPRSKVAATFALCLLGCLLTARGQDPSITNPNYPLNTNVSVGATVSFRVFATTTNGPPTYQWQRDGTILLNATNATFVITNVTVADAGGYMATVWNASNESTNSRTAILTVDTTFTKITQGPVVEDREPSIAGIWGDYDGDVRLDLFVPNSGGVYRNTLYRNLGGDQFVRVTNALTALAASTWGAQWADWDNDGDLDIFVNHPFSASPPFPENRARNEMFRNEGGGVFTPMTNAATAVAGFWTDASWVDHDGDGWLDIFATTQSVAAGQSYDDYFFQNLADGRFAAWTTKQVGAVVKPQSETAGPAWCDIDGDGDLDLYVSKYQGATNFLYRNDGGRLIPVTAGSLPSSRSTWAAVWADFNNDGLFDLFTGGENGTNMLHLNRGNWVFEDVTVASGLVLAGTVYNVAVGDFDNDGDLDLYVPVYDAADVLYVNRGDATFDRVNVGSLLTEGSRNSATWVDYNNDGFLDLFQGCGETTPTLNLLYRNSLSEHGNTNHWLKLRLKGTASNASAIGARVWARATIAGKETWQVRHIVSGYYGVGATDGLQVHFGLGDATSVTTLSIEWPSGNVQELTNVGVDQTLPLTVTESVGITPVRPSASLNGAVTLTRSALSGATYQWRFDGVDLVGQTNRILNLTYIIASQEGRYSIVVSNATTLVTNFVYLIVDTQFSKITAEPWNTDLGNGGVGVAGDYDGDGYQDLFIARFGTGRSVLYHNNTNGTFASITNSTFPLPVGSYFFGPCSDFDNDGRADLFVLPGAGTPSYFLYNKRDGNFTQVPLATLNPWSINAVDYDHDGLLDLYCTAGGGSVNRLFRNLGGRAFQAKTSAQVGAILGISTFGGAAWADYDDDGWEDVVAPDNTSGCRLFRNMGGRFLAVPNQITQSALVANWGDYDNDGLVDLCVGAASGQTAMYRNMGGGNFKRTSVGIAVKTSCNGVAWGDYDNDGFLDLFMTLYNSTGNALFRNNGNGTFTAITTGSLVTDRVTPEGSYAATWFDYDNDGFLDLFVPTGNDVGNALVPNFLYHNNGNSNSWLKVKLVGTTSNRVGAGAKVRVRATYAGASRWQRRDITSSSDGYNGMGPIAHFGLGNATSVTTLRIEWPSGTVQELQNVATKQMLTITEPRRPVLALEATPAGSTGVLKADTNQTYQVHASEDLATGWTVLTNITTDATGLARWSDPPPAPQGRRFYKAVKTP